MVYHTSQPPPSPLPMNRVVRKTWGNTRSLFVLLLLGVVGAAHAIFTHRASGEINTIAGIGEATTSGDGGLATAAGLNDPRGLAFDEQGNLYIAEYVGDRIRRVESSTGIITTYAGGGESLEENVSITEADIMGPRGVTIANNALYFSHDNNAIRKIDLATENVTTVAGCPKIESLEISPDGTPATSAMLLYVKKAVWNPFTDDLYISDVRSRAIRMVNASTGTIETFVGGVQGDSPGDDECVAGENVELTNPIGMMLHPVNNPTHLYFTDKENHRVYKTDLVTRETCTIAGVTDGDVDLTNYPNDEEGTIATAAHLNEPIDVAVDGEGKVFILEQHRIRMIDTDGTISTIAGARDGAYGSSGDGGAATDAYLMVAYGFMAIAPDGGLVFADDKNDRVREITGVAEPPPSPSPSPSITPSSSFTATPTRSPSLTPSITPSTTRTPSVTPSATATSSVTPSATRTPSVTPTSSTTSSTTPSPSMSPSRSPTSSATSSSSTTPSMSPTSSATSTPSVSTSTSPTSSATSTLSVTPSTTPTTTPSPSSTPSTSPTSSATSTLSVTPSTTPTTTPSPSSTPSTSPTSSATSTLSVTPSTTPTTTPSPSSTPSTSPTSSATSTLSVTPSTTPTTTPSPSSTPSTSPTSSATSTLSVTPSTTPTTTPSPSTSPSTTPSVTPSCIQHCTNRQCGSDGCGGVCGTCESVFTCSQDFLCTYTPPSSESNVIVEVEIKGSVAASVSVTATSSHFILQDAPLEGPAIGDQLNAEDGAECIGAILSIHATSDSEQDSPFPVALEYEVTTTAHELDCYFLNDDRRRTLNKAHSGEEWIRAASTCQGQDTRFVWSPETGILGGNVCQSGVYALAMPRAHETDDSDDSSLLWLWILLGVFAGGGVAFVTLCVLHRRKEAKAEAGAGATNLELENTANI